MAIAIALVGDRAAQCQHDQQLLGRSGAIGALDPVADQLRLRAGAGRPPARPDDERLRGCPHHLEARPRRSPAGRSPARRSSRSWGPTAAASSTSTRPTRSRTRAAHGLHHQLPDPDQIPPRSSTRSGGWSGIPARAGPLGSSVRDPGAGIALALPSSSVAIIFAQLAWTNRLGGASVGAWRAGRSASGSRSVLWAVVTTATSAAYPALLHR